MKPLTNAHHLFGFVLAGLAASATAAPARPAAMTFQVQMTINSSCAVAWGTTEDGACKVNCSRGTPFQVWWRPGSRSAGTGAGMAATEALSFENSLALAGIDPAGYDIVDPIMLRVRY